MEWHQLLDFLFLFGMSLLLIEGLMLIVWILYMVQKKVHIIDIAWGINFIIAGLVGLLLGQGYLGRRLVVTLLVFLWAFRLIGHLIKRSSLDKEDARYEKILQSPLFFGPKPLKVLSLYLLQGLVVSVLTIPIFIMAENFFPFFYTLEMVGLLIWMVGFIGEAAADRQLLAFKTIEGNEKLVFKEGLWQYSRHPNYFFEWFIWLGFSTMALASPFGWLGLLSPFLMLYLLLRVSGIPSLESHAVETYGEAYTDYQSETSSFIPWF